jgi:hypothetical protein
MSHPDPCYDPENSYEDDPSDILFAEYLYDLYNGNEDDSMDGDHDSAKETV